jgi:hypothetical protein
MNNRKIILTGKNVVLRPLALNDATNFCRWLADPELTQFLSRWRHQGPPTRKEEREWIQKSFREKNDLNFAIDTVDGVHIGSISLKSIDWENKNAEYGIFIGDKKYWGQGLGTEAGRLIINHGFKKLKLHMIYLRYIAYNIRGEKSYKKIGFRPAGRIRQSMNLKGCYHDQVWMDLIKGELK